MPKEKMKIANLLCDFEYDIDLEKTTEITRRLGDLGIHCYTSDIADDRTAPPTPWLEYDGVIYYSYQIDNVIDRLERERLDDGNR